MVRCIHFVLAKQREREQVTVMNADLKEGLLNTAAVQAGLPAVLRAEGITGVSKMAGAAADAIVVLGGMEQVQDLDGFFSTVLRVLKPGGRCGAASSSCVSTCGSLVQSKHPPTCRFFGPRCLCWA